MENLYCTIYIVDVSHNPEEVETVNSRINQLIEDHGGVIKKHNPWGKRRLAYPINKKNSGFYVEIEFTAQSRLNIPQIIEKEFGLNDRVLRHLTYVVTKEELKQRARTAKVANRADAARTARVSETKKDDAPAKPAAKEAPVKEAPVKEAPAEEAPATAKDAEVVEKPATEEAPAENGAEKAAEATETANEETKETK